jgi:hypothetical protein
MGMRRTQLEIFRIISEHFRKLADHFRTRAGGCRTLPESIRKGHTYRIVVSDLMSASASAVKVLWPNPARSS